MSHLRTSLALALITASVSCHTPAVGAEPTPLKCEIGPLSKNFGRSNWLVYACDDGHSLVVVSDQGNPAMPFYFIFAWKDDAYQLHGEGTGDKKATQAAFDELSKLDKADIEGLVHEAQSKGAK